MDVSIIIVSYNTKDHLQRCLSSIYEKTSRITFEVLVIDNASTDGSCAMVRANFPAVILVANETNLGFGKANNLGAHKARGNYLFFLNSDTILLNNAAYFLCNFLYIHPEIAICGGNLYTEDLKPAISFSQSMPGLYTDIDYFFGRFFSRLKYGRNLNFNFTNKDIRVNGYISGADLMINRQVFLKNKGFDPDFFLYFEETELTHRIRKGGYAVYSIPKARIIHLEGASETTKKSTAMNTFKSKMIYYRKIGRQTELSGSHIIFALTAWQRILIFTLLARRAKVKMWSNLLRWEREAYAKYR